MPSQDNSRGRDGRDTRGQDARVTTTCDCPEFKTGFGTRARSVSWPLVANPLPLIEPGSCLLTARLGSGLRCAGGVSASKAGIPQATLSGPDNARHEQPRAEGKSWILRIFVSGLDHFGAYRRLKEDARMTRRNAFDVASPILPAQTCRPGRAEGRPSRLNKIAQLAKIGIICAGFVFPGRFLPRTARTRRTGDRETDSIRLPSLPQSE